MSERGPVQTHSLSPAEGGSVGASGHGKIDGLDKINGAALFSGDLTLPRMVHAKVLRSPHAHARILSIDATAARASAGVLAVVTGAELPTRYGPIAVVQDETALALDKVRYQGEPVVCVAALTEAEALAALRRIRIVYEPLPAILCAEDALDPSLPPIHEWARKPSNTLRRVEQSFGDVDGAFAGADLVLSADYSYPGSTHVPLEPHVAVAAPTADGRLTVWSSTQNPHPLHHALARVLGMPASQLRVIKPHVGAGYGGKCDPFVTDILAAWLARHLQRPVRFALTREEVFYAHRGRHPTEMKLTMGMRADGTLVGADLRATAVGGAYASYGVVTAYYLGVFGTLPYALDHYRFQASRLYTNHPPCGPKRGHGALQPRFAFEVHLDRMATQLGLDPVAVRRQNLVQPHTETVNGLRITSVGLGACIDEVLAASGYAEKRGRLGPNRGIGLACSAYMCGALHPPTASELPQSGVVLTADRSGRVTIFSGTADVGQGSNQMLVTLVAERLGLPRGLLSVVEADTDLTPVDLGSYSSRVTFMAGNAALQAADRLRALVFAAASAHLRCEPRDLLAADGLIAHRDAPERRLSWIEAVALAEARHGTLSVSGSYTPPKIGSRFRRQSVGPSPAYSFTAAVSELEVDPETGEVRVERIWCAHDLGRVLNPEIARGQIEGCVYMGLGEALFEEQRYRGPALMAPSILEYRIPTAADTPPIEVLFVESHDPEGPFGAKEVGEGPQLAVVPSIANAMFDATGLWWEHPPFTPERVARGLRRARSGR